eukprot:8762369-Alexandrium_andersonii.AAC.1
MVSRSAFPDGGGVLSIQAQPQDPGTQADSARLEAMRSLNIVETEAPAAPSSVLQWRLTNFAFGRLRMLRVLCNPAPALQCC